MNTTNQIAETIEEVAAAVEEHALFGLVVIALIRNDEGIRVLSMAACDEDARLQLIGAVANAEHELVTHRRVVN